MWVRIPLSQLGDEMARRKKYNPERRDWRGRSYKKGGKRVSEIKLQQQ
jgi:hypothetical protein